MSRAGRFGRMLGVGRMRGADAALVEQMSARALQLARSPDRTLRGLAEGLRGGIDPLDLTDAQLTEAFALASEASRRVTGMAHYATQLLAGLQLARGRIVEMATGEGKTLAAVLPACVHGLSGKGVHVMTVNEYLAERDYELLKPVYAMLGLTAAMTRSKDPPPVKKQAYQCDITYGTGPEFGFDYLRDQLQIRQTTGHRPGTRFRDQLNGRRDVAGGVQRPPHFAIVDEVDSVLLDEARTALILSGASGAPSRFPGIYHRAREVAAGLSVDRDYYYDRPRDRIDLTECGVKRVFAAPGGYPGEGLRQPWTRYIEQALRARHVLRPDVDYIVLEDKVQIVDQFTGRRYADRSWSDGLHQAVEAIAGVTITEESSMLLRISRQRYLGFYRVMAGMTGTARGCEPEFMEFYQLPVVKIPLRKTSRQTARPARFFADDAAKWDAIFEEIARVHGAGQPILVGTRSILESEQLSARLAQAGLEHRMLTAKQDAEEAETVVRAGARGAITVATNMAGRGTDIPLQAGVHALGGLHVIATEPHESARVDRQLMGRSARHGEPGSVQLFVAATDRLLVQHAPELGRKISRSRGTPNEAHFRSIRKLQGRIERKRHDERRETYRHDGWAERTLKRAG